MHFPLYSQYFFSKLNSHEQKVYNQLLISWQNFNEKTTIRFGFDSVDYNKVFNALLNDVPELYYVDFSNISVSYAFALSIVKTNFLYAVQTIEEDKRKIDELIKNYFFNSPNKKTLKEAHNFIVDHISYSKDLSNRDIYNIRGALLQRDAVCEGFARSFKLICDYLNIPCVVISGTAINHFLQTEAHAWNLVRINDVSYHIDTTWNRNYKSEGGIPLYYCVSDWLIQLDHQWNHAIWPACNNKGKIESSIIKLSSPLELENVLKRVLSEKKVRIILQFPKQFDSIEKVSKQLEKSFNSVQKNCSCLTYSIAFNKQLRCAIIRFRY